jgi:hypothetical protein
MKHFASMIRAIFACIFLLPSVGLADLPVGSSPQALKFPHFPTAAHTFIFRNWNVVETSRLAKILGTTPEKIRAAAADMGLGAEELIPPMYKARLYLSVIRRNWHLLPYEQLLTLLDMTEAELEHTLREDDFLFVKLGNLKPKCEALKWTEPTPEVQKRCAEIRGLVQKEFAPAMGGPSEPRFAFLEQFHKPVGDITPRQAPANATVPLRYIYSYFAVYGDPLSDPSLDPYPDGLLAKLSEIGVNGVWLHVVLRQLAPDPSFPEFGAGHEKRLAALAKLVERAKRFNIGIYLYMNEPRAMPAAFFKDRPQMAGVREGGYVAMCTSNPMVRQWMANSLAHVFSSVPDLGGVFTISASENLTSCASHYQQRTCPHCKNRSGAEIIAEVNSVIESGVHRSAPNAKVIAWDWGWQDADAPAIIKALPKSVWLQSVSEWSIPINRGGVKAAVGEYSISTVGPGPRATRHWQIAREAGLKTVAKIQANNTWELSAVPALPVLDLVAEHATNLNSANIDGMLLSWTLGGYPSANLDLLRRFDMVPRPTKDDALNSLARDRYGVEGAPLARKAWTTFSESFREYPFDGNVIYNAPIQLGPANLFYAGRTNYGATMVGLPYDDVKGWCGPYPPPILAEQFEKVAGGFKSALVDLAAAVDKAPPERAAEAKADLRVAHAAQIHFQSVANQVRFVLARDSAAPDRVAKLEQLLRDEAELAKQLFSLTRADSRIGFEASNQYYYLPQDLMEKVINCDYIASQLP